MLEKNEKKICDSHFHLTNVPDFSSELRAINFFYEGCSTALSVEEWDFHQNLDFGSNIKITKAFGIHPQAIDKLDIETNLHFLEKLLQNRQENHLAAIGEIGFDYFTKEFQIHKELQEEVFVKQVELALEYKMPVIIHCRKANEKLFEYAFLLKKLPSVLFHSFMGSVVEAESLLKKGINGYFSFGKQLLNNNKKVIDCVKKLPIEVLLAETDAPYQTLKGEKYTFIKDIQTVYAAMAEAKNMKEEDLIIELNNNFQKMFYPNR